VPLFEAYGDIIESDIILAALPQRPISTVPDWTVHAASTGGLAGDIHWRTLWRDASGESWAIAGVARGRRIFRFTRYADFAVESRSIGVTRRAFTRDDTLEHLLIDQVLPLAMAAEGRIVLHASAVADAARQTLAFCGAAGAGKSTLAASLARAGLTVIADDALVVDLDGEPAARPAYCGVRLWADSAGALGFGTGGERTVAEYTSKRRIRLDGPLAPSARFHLRRIHVVEPGDAVSLDRLHGRDALLALVRHAYRADLGSGDALRLQLAALRRLAAAIPVWRLRVPHDLASIDEVATAVLGAV